MGTRPKTRYIGLVAIVLLAGCGSSSLSNSQLEADVSRICTTTEVRTNQIPTPAAPAASAAFLERGATALTPELGALKAVHPPSDVADVYGATVGSFEQKIRELRGTAREIEHGTDPIRAFQRLQERLRPLESQENDGWQALQLPACVSR